MNKGAAALIMLALSVLLLPLQWILAMAAAALWHELCHYWAIRLCGGKVTDFRAGFSGAKLEVLGLTEKQELLCALAGPAGGLLLLLFARWLPRTAMCAAVQSVYNLLPIFPLDGGRILRCGLGVIWPNKAQRICHAVTILTLVFLGALGIWGCFVLRLGILPLLISTGSIMRAINAKFPCKPVAYSLQ